MPVQRPVRHHTVPQFYLRRFADYKKRLNALNVKSGKILLRQHIRNIAVENNFHTITGPDGPIDDIETALGEVESRLAAGLRSLDRRFPPASEAREDISTFVAFQFVRTTRWRSIVQDSISGMLKWAAAFEAAYVLNKFPPHERTAYVRQILGDRNITPDQATELLTSLSDDDYEVEIDHSQHLQQILGVLSDPEYAALVARRSWVMCYTDARHEFLISDHPVAVMGSPYPSGHAGLRNALELSLPIDPRRLLLMTLDPDDAGKRRTVGADEVLALNRRVRDSALRFVYGHPLVGENWLRGELGLRTT